MSHTRFLKNIFLPGLLIFSAFVIQAQAPVLNSLPSSSYVVYLDFDGEEVYDLTWSNDAIHAQSSGLSDAKILEVFQRVAEKFRPFNINVTTSKSVYNVASNSKKIQAIITTTNDWYPSAGGVAQLNSFGEFYQTPCWIFSAALGFNATNIATAAAHEVGHTLGLRHHGQFNSLCSNVQEYHPGKGTGQTAWGPIMGAPYGSNVITWYTGATNKSTCTSETQDDLKTITSKNGFTYRNDDIGNTNATAKSVTVTSNTFADSGIIERNTDVDVFKLVLSLESNVVINAIPFSASSTGNSGAALDVKLSLYNGTQLIAVDSGIAKLNASLAISDLPAGTYYIAIDGHGISNYIDYGGTGLLDYGSLGQYYLSGTIEPNFHLPPVAAFQASSLNTCVGTPIIFTDASSHNPKNWKWISTGASPDSVVSQNATFNFNSTGTYTVVLSVSNSYGTDTFQKTITVIPASTITVSNDTSVCRGQTVTLSAFGAASYTWAPSSGTASVNHYTVTPLTTTTFTVTGTNTDGCIAKAKVAVKFLATPGVPVVSFNNPNLSIAAQSGATYQWFRSGNIIPGATTTSYSLSTGGSYTVVVTYTTGCYATSGPFNFNNTGIETIAGNSLKLFPNPVDNLLTIDIEDQSFNSIRIFDITGKMILNEEIFSNPIKVNVSSWSQGTYMVKLFGNDGIHYEKVMILR